MEDTLSKFMSESAKRHEENSNSIKEIRASKNAAIRNQGASIKTLEIQIGQMSKGSYGPQFSKAYSKASQSIPRKEKDPGSFTLPCFINNVCVDNALVDLGASVYMLSLRETMELDLEARLKGETLVLNRSLNPFFEDYIELNDLNKPFELRRNQSDDLMSTIEEGEDKMEYKGNNVVGTLMNIPIFVGTFSILTDFTVLENMNAYHVEGMGDVIFGEPFLREVGIKTRRFKGMITIYNGNNGVTYQMVRSHPRFEHHTNEQCNKIPPLLKVREEDKMNGISHPYQKLKGFYKGVLNLRPDYIRDVKMEEWLTRGHISVHEIECYGFYANEDVIECACLFCRYGHLVRDGSEQSHVSISSLWVCMCGLFRPPGILKARILEFKRRYFEDYYSDYEYVVSIKEDTSYPALTKDHKRNLFNTLYPEKTNTPY
nr:homeodomain-like protein [Tanacetum cinerariifolium]